jgi:hypothetical protein
MLKVTIVDTRSQRRLIVEGALVYPWVEELKKACAAIAQETPTRRLVVHLSCVTAIGKDGEDILLDLLRQGAAFSCAGIYTRYQLNQIMRKFRSKCGDIKNRGLSNDGNSNLKTTET